MELVHIYAIAVGSISIIPTLGLILYLVIGPLSLYVSKYLTYPYVVKRHTFIGPWTWGQVFICAAYGAVNIFVIFFRASPAVAGRRAGNLSLVNMTFVLAALHLSFLAGIFRISLQNCKRIHRAAGWMTGALLAFHIFISMVIERDEYPLDDSDNLFGLIGAGALAAILLFSLPFFRWLSYEIFLRSHQLVTAGCVYSLWRHLPSKSYFPRMYIYIPLIIMLLTSLVQISTFLYYNGFFTPRKSPRATVTCSKRRSPEEKVVGKPLKIRVNLSRPLKVKAGQYINLWMPSVSLGSWAQTHPFMVTSWSPEKQDVLELFVQTRRGFTSKLEARTAPEGSASYSAFVIGPYGLSEPIDQYESVLAIASGFGIAGVIPYLKQLLYGYNSSTSQVRRVHFVWQVQTLDVAVAAQPLLNSLLTDDVLGNGYILEMSFYVGWKIENETPFGSHHRAIIYSDKPDYNKILEAEASGKLVERLPNTQGKRGKHLVIVSASDELRDELRNIICGYLDRKVKLFELEFQPV